MTYAWEEGKSKTLLPGVVPRCASSSTFFPFRAITTGPIGIEETPFDPGTRRECCRIDGSISFVCCGFKPWRKYYDSDTKAIYKAMQVSSKSCKVFLFDNSRRRKMMGFRIRHTCKLMQLRKQTGPKRIRPINIDDDIREC